ncbi:GspE/PulE family protein [Chengkuizengella axinellae]|uniref:ATPase, T2SS/T4P/T4SS family n=1 Tax=Chengkuizengella axinellae TaxID=3064388 RepID=A0ABT9IY57_9BACL|nr:type II/IV secretion system protein [Chengkuizengella sp. 2205SS18-9]MDP5274299.1 ATPase, T2SS/T4P/T4SS family [Chengkuizengella sp. 2205SS18-9]
MAVTKKRLGDLLVDSGLITSDQLTQTLSDQKNSNLKLGDLLIQKGIITEQQLIQALEFQLGIPHITLATYEIDMKLVNIISEQIAKKYQVIPIRKSGKKLLVAMVDPLDFFAIEDLSLLTGFIIEPALITKDELQSAIASLYGLHESMNQVINDVKNDTEEIDESEITDKDSPVVRLVNEMLEQAVQLRVSDIHVDPMENRILIRYRIDGALRTERILPKSVQGILIARLKIMANLNIAERRHPQDGRIMINLDFKKIDIRVATLPTIHGEKVVLRILDLSHSVKEINNLNLNENNLKIFREMLDRPHGMVLVTGPTGSGKTTTLYSALQHLNHDETNIITIEDPVEYQLEGINQVQVSSQTGLSFSKGLRSILRQDPNIVMVGEIRDIETIDISIRASLTGHLVFSTIHTNSAISTITRLREMGVEPYLISSSLIGIVSQRLVRQICQHCKVAYEPSEQESIFLSKHGLALNVLYKGKGCGVCNRSGYRGRIGIHEILWIDHRMRTLILENATSEQFENWASENGFVSIFEDGLQKVNQGFTTLQEVIKEVSMD